MNINSFQNICKGEYGRKIAYTDADVINESNVVKVASKGISVLNHNKTAIKYLHEYMKGDQPVLYRSKTIRDDVNNPVCENHAYEIVAFKNAQTYGEPVQIVSLKSDESKNLAVDKFNDYCRAADKAVKDITSGEWTSSVGVGFKAVQRTADGSVIPFRIVTPSPLNTVIVYSNKTEEPMLAVIELVDDENITYWQCFSDKNEYIIHNNGELMPLPTVDGSTTMSRPHAFGGIPVVEYPNNADRISDIELVISMLDAINEYQSNRVDAVCQFVQSFFKFENCEVDEETFNKMKMNGAFVVHSVNGEQKANVDILSQELDQTQTQVAKQDLLDNVWSISAIPNREGGGSKGGDSAGAVELRGGWDFSKQRTNLKDQFIVSAEKKLDNVIIKCIQIAKGINECDLTPMDYDVHIVHSPTDNLFTKSEALQLLLSSGIHPLVAIRASGLWSDSEKVYLQSKPYLDVIYKRIDDIIENDADLTAQMDKAKAVLKTHNAQNEA